jgi:hypothetical protein
LSNYFYPKQAILQGFMGKSALCQQAPDPGATDSEEWCNVRVLRLHWFTWKAVPYQVYEEIKA